jgi:predicted dehydrogenase
MEKIYNIGIVGAGMIAEKHIDSFLKIKRAKVAWLADINPEVLSRVSQKHSIEKTTVDYRQMLDDRSLDVIVVCTPPPFHKIVFLDAIAAEKHILVEKPLAMNIKDIDEMIAAKNAKPNIKVSDCSARHSRLQPKFRAVKSIIDSGVLGEIYYIHHNCIWRQARGGIEYHPTAKWFLNKAIAGGGPLFDWGVYDLSFHLGVLGDYPQLQKVNNVFLKNGLDAVDPGCEIFDVEEHFMVNMEFNNGIKYYWERANNANMEADSETRIYGTRGGLKFGFHSWDPAEITFFDVDENSKGKARKEVRQVDMSQHGGDDFELAAHFVRVLDEKQEPAMPLELAKKHLEIIWKCYESAI